MPWYLVVIFIYLLVINLIAVILTIYDKKCAQQGRWRIPEATLLWISAFGGAVGMYITMKRIRHKTQKKKFMLGIPVIFMMELVVAICIICSVTGRIE